MEKPNTIRVVSAVADKKQVILYLEDGNTLIIKQGDHRLGDLLDIIIPITVKGEVAVINLQDFSIYAAFENKTQGMTKFFRMTKNKVKGWFGGETETHKATLPEDGKAAIMAAVMGTSMTEEEVTEHGQPVDMTDEVGDDEVVVAVVENKETGKKAVIPGVQAIKPLIDHAVRTNSAEAVQAFLSRCAKFIDKRQHSVDDLMRFLEQGDLPLAEDGSIIAYKMLKYGPHPKGGDLFVDCHSGNITQRVGSYVCVNESLVDLNRRNECSNGLHIARRGYLGGFEGDVCVLCKIDPEDVMVVPHNDPNKVRVKGYHILAVMSDEAMKLLKQNKPMTGEEDALEAVYRAIKGDHIDRIERVQVNGQYGSKVEVTKLKHEKSRDKDAFSHTGSDLKKAAALDDESIVAGSVDPREINKRVTTEHEKLSGNTLEVPLTNEGGPNSHGTKLDQSEELLALTEDEKQAVEEMHDDIVDRLAAKPEAEKPASELDLLLLDYNTAPEGNVKVDAARALVAFKKAKKKGWDKLGIEQKVADAILADAQTTASPAPVKASPKPKAGTKEKKAKVSKPAPTPVSKEVVKSITDKKTGGTKAEQARSLYDAWQKSGKADDFAKLADFKKKTKKSWAVLGFSNTEITKIEAAL